MSKNWLGRKVVISTGLLGCFVMGFCGTTHAQEFYLSMEGNPQVSSTFGTPVAGGFNTGRVPTVGPLTKSDNLSSSGAEGSNSSSANYGYNIEVELGHLKGSALVRGRATGTTAVRAGGSGNLTLHMTDRLISNGVGDFKITLTLRSRVVHTPVDSDCTNSTL